MTTKDLLLHLEVAVNKAMATNDVNALEHILLDIQYIKELENTIKEYLKENPDNLQAYQVVNRKTYKILNEDELRNKYPIEKYPDLYKITFNTKKVLDNLPHEEVEYEEKITTSIVKKRNLENK